MTFPDTVFCKSSILSFISGLERCHVRILFHWDTGNPCSFSFVVFWFVRQINCEMNIKREIEASVINHLLALSLCQCHYTHARTHTHGNRKRIHMCLYIRDHTCFYDVSNGGTVRQNTLHDAITEMSHKWHAIIKVSVCMCVWLHGRICSNIILTCTTCKVILLCCQ